MLRGEALESYLSTVVEGLIDTAYIHSEYRNSPAVVETSLGYTPKHRHRTTLEVGLTAVTAAALVTLMASSGGFTVTTTWAATDSFPFAVLKDPAMDIVEVHGETRSNLISVTLFNLDSVEAGNDLRQTSLTPPTVVTRSILLVRGLAVQRLAQPCEVSTVRRLSL